MPGSVPSVSYFDTWTSRKDDVFDYTQNAPVPMTGSMVNGTLVPVTDATGQPISRSQLPRIMAIQKVVAETRSSERGKLNSPSTSDVTAPTPTTQSTDLIRPAERVDQAAPANPIEIPNLPHLPVVRTVAMEVGDPGSQVTIHIQERGGDVAMQLNTASDSLHQILQSSVGSLVQSLKQEQVQVSNVEVTRKSPIDKVRRMKEAQ